MCQLQVVRWACGHTQRQWQLCPSAPPTPKEWNLLPQPCAGFVSLHGLRNASTQPTASSLQHLHCCRSTCCAVDCQRLCAEMQELEDRMGYRTGQKMPLLNRIHMTPTEKAMETARERYKKAKAWHQDHCDQQVFVGRGWREEMGDEEAVGGENIVEKEESLETMRERHKLLRFDFGEVAAL